MSFYQIGLVLLSFVATAGFALNFKLWNKKHLLVASISGAAGYAAYLFFSTIFDTRRCRRCLVPGWGLLGMVLPPDQSAGAHYHPAGHYPAGARTQSVRLISILCGGFLDGDRSGRADPVCSRGIALGILLASLFSVSLRRMRRLNVIGRKERKQP